MTFAYQLGGCLGALAAVAWESPSGGDEALRIVDFSIFSHLDHKRVPDNTMTDAERSAARLGNAAYAIDDETAIRVVDVVSEGQCRHFPAA